MAKKFKQIIFIIILLIGSSLLFFMIAHQKTPVNKQQTGQSSFKVAADSKQKDMDDIKSKNSTITSHNPKSGNITQNSEQDELIANHIAAFEDAFYSQNGNIFKEIEVLLEIGKPVVPQLLGIIANKNHEFGFRKITFEIIEKIGDIDTESTNLLIKIMNDKEDDPFIRAEAALALGKTDSKEAAQPLM